MASFIQGRAYIFFCFSPIQCFLLLFFSMRSMIEITKLSLLLAFPHI